MDMKWRKQRWTRTLGDKPDSRRMGWKAHWSLAAFKQLPGWGWPLAEADWPSSWDKQAPGQESGKVKEEFPNGWTGSLAASWQLGDPQTNDKRKSCSGPWHPAPTFQMQKCHSCRRTSFFQLHTEWMPLAVHANPELHRRGRFGKHSSTLARLTRYKSTTLSLTSPLITHGPPKLE